MRDGPPLQDLVILVPCQDIEMAVKGLLTRQESMRIRGVQAHFIRAPGHDPACYSKCGELLRPYHRRYRHALTIFDREGSGGDQMPRAELERDAREKLIHAGWEDRAEAIAIDPEVEVWVFSDSPHLATAVGWSGETSSLRLWLEKKGWWVPGESKPTHPKEALNALRREARLPASSSLYTALASKVSLGRCGDPAFNKLLSILQSWFPLPRDNPPASS